MTTPKELASAQWANMDSFWDMIDGKPKITAMWEAICAWVEDANSHNASNGSMSLPIVPIYRTHKHVVVPVSGVGTGVWTMDTSGTDIDGAEDITIPSFMAFMNGDTYYDGPDYYVDGTDITWTTDPDNGATHVYIEAMTTRNTIIASHWKDALWDAVDLSSMDASTAKDMIYAMYMARAYPPSSQIHKISNMLLGAKYAKYPGFAAVSGTNVTMTYVNDLYVFKHNGVMYGAKSMSEAAINEGDMDGVKLDRGGYDIGSIFVSDTASAMVIAKRAGYDILDANLPSDTYMLYTDAVNISDCYAIRGTTAYSCWIGFTPDSDKYTVTHALNYPINISSEVLACGADDILCENGDYVPMHAIIGEKAKVVDWKSTGGIVQGYYPIKNDDPIANIYGLEHGGAYLTLTGTIEDGAPEYLSVSEGDKLLAHVGCVTTYSVEQWDSATLTCAMIRQQITDRFDSTINDVYPSFIVGETVIANIGSSAALCVVGSGNYDGVADQISIVIIPVSGSIGENISTITKSEAFKDIHTIMHIDYDGETETIDISTDKPAYSSDCRVLYYRHRDDTYGNTIMHIDDAMDQSVGGVPGIALKTSHPMHYTNNVPGSAQVIIMGDMTPRLHDIEEISDGDEYYLITKGTPAPEEDAYDGKTMVYVGNLYRRNVVYIKCSGATDTQKANIISVCNQLLPHGFQTQIYEED